MPGQDAVPDGGDLRRRSRRPRGPTQHHLAQEPEAFRPVRRGGQPLAEVLLPPPPQVVGPGQGAGGFPRGEAQDSGDGPGRQTQFDAGDAPAADPGRSGYRRGDAAVHGPVAGGVLDGEGGVPDTDDDGHGGAGQHPRVQPRGGAVPEAAHPDTAHPDTAERAAAEGAGDLPAPLGVPARSVSPSGEPGPVARSMRMSPRSPSPAARSWTHVRGGPVSDAHRPETGAEGRAQRTLASRARRGRRRSAPAHGGRTGGPADRRFSSHCPHVSASPSR